MQSTILLRDVIIYAIGFEVFGPRFLLSFNLSKSEDFDFQASKPK